MKTTLKHIIKEAILEALLEFTLGGVATVDEEFKEDDKNTGGGDVDNPSDGGGSGSDTIPDNGGNDTIPGRPGPLIGPVGFSLR